MNLKKQLIVYTLGAMFSGSALSAIDIKLDDGTTFSFGGYIKADARFVSGDLAYREFWIGNSPAEADTSALSFTAQETRFNFSVKRDVWKGFIELDFYGASGNQIISNSHAPRLRHAFIKNKKWLFGQTWSAYTPLHSIAETLNFGEALGVMSFIRQPQIRYTCNNFVFSIEQPETWGDGDIGVNHTHDPDEAIPDLVLRYNKKADWGMTSFGALIRTIDQGDEPSAADSVAFATNIAGKINVGDKDHLKFEINAGQPGRYVGVTLPGGDIVTTNAGDNEVIDSTTFKFSYRHVWGDDTRSTFFYGVGMTDEVEDSSYAGNERSSWGLNYIKQVTPKIIMGVEVGSYTVDDEGMTESLSSTYLQSSVKLSI